jgi:ComF family protein
MASIFPHILRFFLPWACAGCRTPLASLEDEGFCGSCWLAIPRIRGPVCYVCGIPLKYGGRLCYGCRQAPPPLIIRAAAEYNGVIPSAVYRYKYLGRKSLARAFGALLRYAWEQAPEIQTIDALIPVPLFKRNERLRGYNQAELLAHELARGISRPVLPLLVRTRKTPSQITMNRNMRRENVRQAFALHPFVHTKRDLLKGKSYLLVDDVCTTTSTLGECAITLHRAGIRSVGALVLARGL